MLVVVPVTNPISYGTATGVTPGDGMNLNRVMPGTVNGAVVSERLAAALSPTAVQTSSTITPSATMQTAHYSYMHDNGAEC